MTKNSQNSISQTKSNKSVIDFNDHNSDIENGLDNNLNENQDYSKGTAYSVGVAKNNESHIDLKKASIELVSNMMRNTSIDCVLKGDIVLNALKRVHMQLMEFDNFCKNREPAVPIEDSVQPNFIYCLEDGKRVTILRKHLRNKFNMTPKQYRAKWNLPADYPMVPKDYSVARSALAKETGLGLLNRKRKYVGS